MSWWREPRAIGRRAAILFAIVLLAGCRGEPDRAWHIEAAPGFARTFSIAAPDGALVPYYDAGTGLFFFTAPQEPVLPGRIWPEHLKFTALKPDAPPERFVFSSDSSDLTKSRMSRPRPVLEYRETIVLGGAGSPEKIIQPYGSTVLKALPERPPYDSLRLTGKTSAALANLHGGGAVFRAAWTQDGRYVFIERLRGGTDVARTYDFAILGPLENNSKPGTVLADIEKHDRETQKKRMDDMMRQGKIGSAERYGLPYRRAVQRIISCPALMKFTGPFSSLGIAEPGHVTEVRFGAYSGQQLLFTFTSARGPGRIRTTVIESNVLKESYDREYRALFDMVHVMMDNGSTSFYCPGW